MSNMSTAIRYSKTATTRWFTLRKEYYSRICLNPPCSELCSSNSTLSATTRTLTLFAPNTSTLISSCFRWEWGQARFRWAYRAISWMTGTMTKLKGIRLFRSFLLTSNRQIFLKKRLFRSGLLLILTWKLLSESFKRFREVGKVL